MPKVGKITIRFHKDEQLREFDLHYSQKEKFHIKNVPHEFVRLTEFISSGYATEEGLRDRLHECVHDYQEKLKTERDVILYKICASTHLTSNITGEGNYSGQKKGVSKRISGMGYGVPVCSFGVEYKKCKEIDEGGKKYFPYKEDGTLGYEMRVEKSWSVIDWTPERESFFLSMYDNMENMIQKISLFFGDDDERVLSLIDAAHGNLKLIQ